jgi:hypothetical protein
MEQTKKSLLPFSETNGTILLSGSTGSGKTYFMYKVLRDMDFLFVTPPNKIKYFYSSWQKLYDKMIEMLGSRISFEQGVPNEESVHEFLQTTQPPSMLIFDDLSRSFLNDKLSEQLYCVQSHHSQCFVFCLQHSLYYKAQFSRIVSLNSKIYIFLTNHRNADQIKTFSYQTQIGQALVESYLDAINSYSYGYLVCDLSVNCPADLRIRTQIFKDDEHLIVYIPTTSKTYKQLMQENNII